MTVEKTLAQIENKVTYVADIRGKTAAGGRHPMAADVDVEINDAYGRMLTMLVNKGWSFGLVETAQAALPVARADTNEDYSLVDWPQAALLIKRIDVYSQGDWVRDGLQEVDWTQLRAVPGAGRGATNSHPTHFSPKASATVATTVVTTGKIALAPFGSSGVYKMTYLPRWTAITDTTHKFIYPDDFCVEWHVQTTALKVIQRDKDYQKRRSDCLEALAMCSAEIASFVPKAIQAGPTQMRRGTNYRSG